MGGLRSEFCALWWTALGCNYLFTVANWFSHLLQAFLPPLLFPLPHFYFCVLARLKKSILALAPVSTCWKSQTNPEMQQPADTRQIYIIY